MEEKEIITTEKVEEVKTEEKKEVVSKEEVAKEMGLTLPKNFGDVVFNTIQQYTSNDSLTLFSDYNLGNAMKGAVLTLQQTVNKDGRPLMQCCTKDSIAQSLLEMVIQGLDVTAKQCYFIVRGDKLTMMRSYFGSVRTLKRLPEIKDVWATVVYKGDTFKTGIKKGRDVVLEHETSFENRSNEIIGGYAIIEKVDGNLLYTIMNKDEIDKAWNKSSSRDKLVHKEFPQEMAKRTLINRACKIYINTEVNNDVLVRAYNNTTSNEYESGSVDTSRKVVIEAKTEEMIDV